MKLNTGFYTYDAVTLDASMNQDKQSGWRFVLQWASEVAGQHQAHCEPAVCLGSQEGKLNLGGHQTQHSQTVKRGGDPTVFSTGVV